MKLYKTIYVVSTNNKLGRAIDKLVKCKPCPLGQRWSSNIHMHINNRAGFKQNLKIEQE